MKKNVSTEGYDEEKDAQLLKSLASRVKPFAQPKKLSIQTFKKSHKLKIHVVERIWRDSDGESKKVTLARAANTDMWPMGTNYWTRDNALIAARLLFSPFKEPEKTKNRILGKKMLLSSLTLMSSTKQLGRFNRIIASKSWQFCCEQNNWPHIFFNIKDNLNADKNEPWAHKQDAWQILAWYTIKALEEHLVCVSELSAKHKKFLGLIAPFLAKVKYYQQENSGSWEELPALRSSVLCWEIRLLEKIAHLSLQPKFSFLKDGYDSSAKNLTDWKSLPSLSALCDELLRRGIVVILQQLPFESPAYKKSDARYREADAALYYLLELDFAYFIASYLGWDDKLATAIEDAILNQIMSLVDPLTGAIKRYKNDSYQRVGFFRYKTCAELANLYGSPSGDASKHFVGRDKIVPQGREAVWVHFVWQLAAFAGRRFQATNDKKYLNLRNSFLARGMNLSTRKNEVSIEQKSSGELSLIKLPSGLIPECWISEKQGKKDIVFPSPHTPLNWATAEALSALAWAEI